MKIVLDVCCKAGGSSMGRTVKEGEYIQRVGHFTSVAYARRQMEISWMNREELANAIPPAYTEYIGKQYKEIFNDKND